MKAQERLPAPLAKCIRWGDIAGMERLLEKGRGDVLARRSREGLTALDLAIASGQFGAAQALLAAGADPNLRSHDDARSGSSLLRSIGMEDESLVAALLAHGAAVNARETSRNTPLIVAVNLGAHSIVDLLLEAGADAGQGDDVGYRPLHQAAARGDAWCIHRLAAHGADPDARADSGHTALMCAAMDEEAGACEALISVGASAALRGPSGSTAADYARGVGAEELAEWLRALEREQALRGAVAHGVPETDAGPAPGL